MQEGAVKLSYSSLYGFHIVCQFNRIPRPRRTGYMAPILNDSALVTFAETQVGLWFQTRTKAKVPNLYK